MAHYCKHCTAVICMVFITKSLECGHPSTSLCLHLTDKNVRNGLEREYSVVETV
jgi:hypothetical protein